MTDYTAFNTWKARHAHTQNPVFVWAESDQRWYTFGYDANSTSARTGISVSTYTLRDGNSILWLSFADEQRSSVQTAFAPQECDFLGKD